MPSLVLGCDEPGPPRGLDDWVVMRRTVEFVGPETLNDGDDVTLAIDAPPRASCVAVRRGVLPKIGRQQAFGFVDCFEKTGLILFGSKQPNTRREGGGIDKHLLVANITTRSVIVLPAVPPSLSLRPSGDRMGILRDPRRSGREFTVAQLHPSEKQVLCFRSCENRWSEERISAPSSVLGQVSVMETDVVFPHTGALCFVDLGRGILVIDIFAVEGVTAQFIPLPVASNPRNEIGSRGCCVAPSSDNLVYVLVDNENVQQFAVVRSWVLEDGKQWSLRNKTQLGDVKIRNGSPWLLPGDMPAIAVAHPREQHKMLFFLGESLVLVNLYELSVLDSHVFHSTDIGSSAKSSLYVWAWVPPPMAPRAVLQVPSGRKMEKMRRCARFVVNYITQNPGKALQLAGAFVEKGGMIVVPIEWRTLSDALASGLKKAGLFIEQNNITHMLQGAADDKEFTGRVLELQYVRTREDAEKIIDDWNSLGRPDDCLGVKFHESLEEKEMISELCQLFKDRDAETLLLNDDVVSEHEDQALRKNDADDEDGGWMIVIG